MRITDYIFLDIFLSGSLYHFLFLRTRVLCSMTFDSYAKTSSHGDAAYLSACMSQGDKRDSRVGRSTKCAFTRKTQLDDIWGQISIYLLEFFATNISNQQQWLCMPCLLWLTKVFFFSLSHTYVQIRYFAIIRQENNFPVCNA